MTHEEQDRILPHLRRIQPHINDAIDQLHKVLDIANVPLRVQQISFGHPSEVAAGPLVPCKIDGQTVLMPPPCP